MFVSIGEHRGFTAPGREKVGRPHFARNVLLTDGRLGDYGKEASCLWLDI